MTDMLLEINPNEQPKLPTLAQWLRKIGKSKMASKYLVFKVWSPNNFPNYTIETEVFRVRISEDNPAFHQFRDIFNGLVEGDKAFAIAVAGSRDGSFSLAASNEKGSWVPMGEAGWKFERD